MLEVIKLSVKVAQGGSITIMSLHKELDSLKKKLFLYETLSAEKDIKNGHFKGPFKNGKDVIAHIKN